MLIQDVTPELLLKAYMSGLFPMADSRDDPEIFWVEPSERGIFPLDGLHISRSLKKQVRRAPYKVTINRDFRGVMKGCAQPAEGRESTWISTGIEEIYCQLNAMGFAHSVECWDKESLVGGLYGVCINGAFFGESMFSRANNASKIALVHLVGRMIAGGFKLLDSQFVTDHLETLGCIEVPKHQYTAMLEEAIIEEKANFYSLGEETSGETVLQSITQIS